MLDRLDAVCRRQEEVLHRLQEPAAAADAGLYGRLMKEYKNLEPIVEAYREYTAAEKDYAEARQLLDEGGLEPGFKAMVQQQRK